MKKNAGNRKPECKTSVYLQTATQEFLDKEQAGLGLTSRSAVIEAIIAAYRKVTGK